MKPHRIYRRRAASALGIFFGVSLIGLAGMVGTASAACENAPNPNAQCETPGPPAPGTVGNADDKNPPGQANNPNDKNKGYECDDNQGIGKGNPAHTNVCTTGGNPPGGPGPGPAGGPSGDVTITSDTPDTPVGEVLGEVLEAPEAQAETFVAAPAAAETSLPRTGSETVKLALFAFGLLFTGLGLVGFARPKETLVS